MTIGETPPKALQNELAADETLLWHGQPGRLRVGPLVFGVFQTLFIIGFVLMTKKLNGAEETTGPSVTLLGETYFLENSPFFVPPMLYFIGIAVVLPIAAAIHVVWQSSSSVYAVTDQRVVLKSNGIGGVLSSIPLREIRSVQRYGRGRGSVLFQDEVERGSQTLLGRLYGQEHEFFAIRDPERVEQLVRQQMNTQHQDSPSP